MRLKEIRKQKKLTQAAIASKMGVTQATYSGWENEKISLESWNLVRLTDIFEVSADYILGLTDEEDSMAHAGIPVPVCGNIRAGMPSNELKADMGYEYISPELAVRGDYFGLKIKGDSMAPRMLENDIVIVRRQPKCENGEIVVIMVGDEDAAVKKLKITKKGIMLVSLNPSYDPYYYSKKEMAELPVRVLGKVVELRGKY